MFRKLKIPQKNYKMLKNDGSKIRNPQNTIKIMSRKVKKISFFETLTFFSFFGNQKEPAVCF